MGYTVYVIENIDGKWYIGHTNNLVRRVAEHNAGMSRYTSRCKNCWRVIYSESWATRRQAMKREKALKTGKGRDFLKSVIIKSNTQSSGVAQR